MKYDAVGSHTDNYYENFSSTFIRYIDSAQLLGPTVLSYRPLYRAETLRNVFLLF